MVRDSSPTLLFGVLDHPINDPFRNSRWLQIARVTNIVQIVIAMIGISHIAAAAPNTLVHDSMVFVPLLGQLACADTIFSRINLPC